MVSLFVIFTIRIFVAKYSNIKILRIFSKNEYLTEIFETNSILRISERSKRIIWNYSFSRRIVNNYSKTTIRVFIYSSKNIYSSSDVILRFNRTSQFEYIQWILWWSAILQEIDILRFFEYSNSNSFAFILRNIALLHFFLSPDCIILFSQRYSKILKNILREEFHEMFHENSTVDAIEFLIFLEMLCDTWHPWPRPAGYVGPN